MKLNPRIDYKQTYGYDQFDLRWVGAPPLSSYSRISMAGFVTNGKRTYDTMEDQMPLQDLKERVED